VFQPRDVRADICDARNSLSCAVFLPFEMVAQRWWICAHPSCTAAWPTVHTCAFHLCRIVVSFRAMTAPVLLCHRTGSSLSKKMPLPKSNCRWDDALVQAPSPEAPSCSGVEAQGQLSCTPLRSAVVLRRALDPNSASSHSASRSFAHRGNSLVVAATERVATVAVPVVHWHRRGNRRH
jgi:hypothetical protein